MLLAVLLAAFGCYEAPQVAVTDFARIRVTRLNSELTADQVREGVGLEFGYDHLMAVHSTFDWDEILTGMNNELAAALIGDWFEGSGSQRAPFPAAEEWIALRPKSGDNAVFEYDGEVWILRCEQRVHADDKIQCIPPIGRRQVGNRGTAANRPNGAAVLVAPMNAILETMAEDLGLPDPDGTQRLTWWLETADEMNSALLRLRALYQRAGYHSDRHQLAVSTLLLEEVLDLATELRFPERVRGLFLRRITSELQHSLRPHDALRVLQRFSPTMRGEGRYDALCAVGESLHDLGRFSEALDAFAAAAAVGERLTHVHGPNAQLLTANTLHYLGRSEEADLAANEATRFAFTKMHLGDRLAATHLQARIYLDEGKTSSAAELARQGFLLSEQGTENWKIREAMMWILADAAAAAHDPTKTREWIDQIVGNLPAGRADPERAAGLSKAARAVLGFDENTAALWMAEALDAAAAAGIDHVDLEAKIEFLRWTLRTGHVPRLAERIASSLYDSFDAGTKCHEPFYQTPYKSSEQEALTELLRYLWAIGDTERARRTAERIVGRQILRTLRVIRSGSFSTQALLSVLLRETSFGNIESDPHLGVPILARGPVPPPHENQVAVAVADRLLDLLNGEDPYPYAEFLAPTDLFIAYVSTGSELLVLWWKDDAIHIDQTPTGGAAPIPTITGLAKALETPLRLSDTDVREQSLYELSEILLAPVKSALGASRRVLVSPGPLLGNVPFTALAYKATALGAVLPVLQVETGLPMESFGNHVNSQFSAENPVRIVGDPAGDLPRTRAILESLCADIQLECAVGDEATTVNLLRAPLPSRLLHVDTHAEPASGSVPGARLLFADRWLEPSEWIQPRKISPWMVSIIACRASNQSGEKYAPLGLNNLAGVLMLSGSSWIMTTSTMVTDEASAEFMSLFLDATLVKGEAPDWAFRDSIAHVLQGGWKYGREWEAFRLAHGGGSMGEF